MRRFARPSLVLVAIALTVVPGMMTIAKAQHLNGLPSCATRPLFSAVEASGCGFAEAKCVCAARDKIFPLVEEAVRKACDPADQAALKALAEKYCGITSAAALAPSPRPTATTTHTHTHSDSSPTKGMTLTTSTSTSKAVVTKTHEDSTSTEKATTTENSSTGSTTYHKTMTYRTTSTSMPVETGGAMVGRSMSAGGLVLAVAGMGWIFAEF